MSDHRHDTPETRQDGSARQVPIRPAPPHPSVLPTPPTPSPTYHPSPPSYVSPPSPTAYMPAPYPTMPATPPAGATTWGYAPAWAPRADIYEEDGDYVIITDVPGIDVDTLDLTWDAGELVLEASIRSPERPQRKPLVKERPAGTYYRRIYLAPDLDPAQAVASYCDGILEVRVPFRKRRGRRRVQTTRTRRPEPPSS